MSYPFNLFDTPKYAYPHITGKKKKETFSLNLHNWYLLELESEPISL